jgi:hypothetical protein
MKRRRRIALISGLVLPLAFLIFFSLTGSGICSLYYESAWNYIILGVFEFLILGYSFNWFIDIKSNLKSVLFFLSLLIGTALEIFMIALAINFHCWTF